jgi:hypothetical protein
VRLWWERAESFAEARRVHSNPDFRPAMLLRNDTARLRWVRVRGGESARRQIFGRWTRTVGLEKGRYRVWTIADDGVEFTSMARASSTMAGSLAELYAARSR